jgi:1L-myo-inositol 1-phosphate cytidylyltransferase / CDP-L-myo-inositol myo-inositolphosphotransferase
VRTLFVPLSGHDPQLFRRSNRERNERVAARAGATVADLETLLSLAPAVAVLVRPEYAIDIELFAALDDVKESSAWLESTPGCAVLAGPADQLARFAASPADAAALPRRPVAPAAILDASTRQGRRRAERLILQRTGKATDGWVSRHWNRPVSRAISSVLLSLGLAASHASILTLLLGFATAAIAMTPGYSPMVWTGVLFQFASILDGVDGEMARATLTESESGARLDTIVDQLTYVTCFAGITIGWIREGSGRAVLWWTVGVGIALVVSLARGGRFVARHAENASFVFIDRAVRRAARDTGLATLQFAAGAFTLLRRDVFAVIFLAVGFTGQRVLVPALIALGVIVANATFSVHSRELAAAATAERLAPS